MKRFISTLLTAAVALTAMVLPASAEFNRPTIQVYFQDCENWAVHTSETLRITGDGTFTLTVSDIGGVQNFTTLYLKDESLQLSEEWNNATLTVNSLRFNDYPVLLSQYDFPIVNQGLFDVCLINVWSAASTFVQDVTSPADQTMNLIDASGNAMSIDEIVIEFKISGLGVEAETTVATEPPAPETEATTEATTTEATTTEATTPATTTELVLESESGGISPIIIVVIVLVLALIGGGIFFFIRRKNRFY